MTATMAHAARARTMRFRYGLLAACLAFLAGGVAGGESPADPAAVPGPVYIGVDPESARVKMQASESLPDSYEVRRQTPLERRFDPMPERPDLGSDNSYGGYDLWMTRQNKDGSWSVPVNLGPNVNSSVRELSPAVSADGKLLYFAAKDRPDGRGEEDIYVCERRDDHFGPARNLGQGVNTAWEDLGPCPLPDGRTLIFSRRDPRQASHDLAISVLIEGVWLNAIGIGRPLATPGQERFPSVTADGKVLYFCADWRGGRGLFDIWQSYRDEHGGWSEPINLGPIVNSSTSEYSPAISPDGNRLFFSSQRSGSTAWDIYLSERKPEGSWQTPVALPSPVNTPEFNEYSPAVAPDGRTLYFASDRHHGRPAETPIEE